MLEEDTCRICSAPAEPDQPLFHPCKCSGTIRYIHQDCLTTWLAHSRKKSCDVCKYQYSFTKVYSPNMPAKIPVVLFLRRLAQQIFWTIVLILRGIMVSVIWLAVVPYVTVWTWRFYFVMGDHIAWWINDRPRPGGPANVFGNNSTLYPNGNLTMGNANITFAEFATNISVWRALSTDIFTGQIIASLIVLAFLGIFLLREWIVQNARPGVFEDNDAPLQDDPPVAHDDHAAPPPAMPPAPVLLQPPEPLPALPAEVVPPHGLHQGLEDDTMILDPEEQPWHLNNASRKKPVPMRPPFKEPVSDSDYDTDGPRTRQRRSVNDRRHDREDGPYRSAAARQPLGHTGKGKGRANGHSFHRNSAPASTSSPSAPGPSTPLGKVVSDFEFTFEMQRRESPEFSSLPSSPLAIEQQPFFFGQPNGEQIFNFRPTVPLPYPLTDDASQSESQPPAERLSRSASPPRRPPLPLTTVPPFVERTLADPTSDMIASSSGGLPRSIEAELMALSSPGLATYRAPEDLDTRLRRGHFENELQAENGDQPYQEHGGIPGIVEDADMAVEFDHYFQESRDEGEDEDESAATDVDADADVVHDDIAPLGVDSEDEEEWDERQDVAEVDREGQGPELDRLMREQVAQVEEVPAPLDPNDDLDGNVDDEMDGALEAIGMRGAVTAVFQNAALMILGLDLTMGLCVFLPFIIGKTSALLSLEPHRIVQIIHFPIKGMRLLTDPIVDTCFLLLQKGVFPISMRVLRTITAMLSHVFLSLATALKLDSGRLVTKVSELTTKPVEGALYQWEKVFNMMTSPPQEDAVRSGFLHSFLPPSDSPAMIYAEPHFAYLGQRVRESSEHLMDLWAEMAIGDTPMSKIFAVTLGYVVVGVAVALYLNILNVGSVQSAGRAVRSAIRQQLIVVKVAAFIVIELVLFPLGCGVMLDVCTLHLFPETSVRLRAAFSLHAPVTATFYHWMIGTMFMYQFAILLAGCRAIMRPGAMWFIKDPQDQNFHPIRDILDRPTTTQLRKLAVSAVMYAVVVACGMGSIIVFFRIWGKTLMPFRWKMREPLSEIPVDLLFLHLVLPPTIRSFEPRDLTHKLTAHYWRWAARQLRLTSYMFGGRHPLEEHSGMLPAFMRAKGTDVVDDGAPLEGSLRRVPAGDNIALPKEMRATIEVNTRGEPVTEAGRLLMDSQNAEAEKAKRNVKDDYEIVYIPPHFRQRVILFIIALWLVGSSVCVTGVALPIRLGRSVFALFVAREVHDGYSFVIGFYLLWGCFAVARALDRLDKRRQRASAPADTPRAEWPLYIAKRGLLWFGKAVWMLFWLGVVIPTLIAIVMDVYLVIPLRLIVNPDVTLRIYVVESWAIGLLYAKMAVSTMRYRPQNKFDAALARIKRNGWRRPDAMAATLEVIAPVTGGLLAMLLLPPLVVWLVQRAAPLLPAGDKLLFLYVYPGIFAAAALARAGTALAGVWASWAQTIRDTEFLVEMRLRNLEPEAALPSGAVPGSVSPASASDTEVRR